MAFRHGSKAEIMVNTKDLSAFCDNLALNVTVDSADTSTFGSTWKSALPGLAGATLNLSGDFDPTITTGPAFVLMACITGGVAVAVVHKPGGTLGGQRTNSFNAFVTGYSETSTVNDKVTFSADMLVTGAITPSTQ